MLNAREASERHDAAYYLFEILRLLVAGGDLLYFTSGSTASGSTSRRRSRTTSPGP